MSLKKIKNLDYAKNVIEKLNFELVDLEFVKEGQNFFLRFFIDKEGGITINDCETASRQIEKVLDEQDPIDFPYILEVSSPGLDRPLKKESDFIKHEGELVDVKLYKAIDKKKEFQGTLLGLCDNLVSICDEDGNLLRFDLNEIAIIRLAVVF